MAKAVILPIQLMILAAEGGLWAAKVTVWPAEEFVLRSKHVVWAVTPKIYIWMNDKHGLKAKLDR